MNNSLKLIASLMWVALLTTTTSLVAATNCDTTKDVATWCAQGASADTCGQSYFQQNCAHTCCELLGGATTPAPGSKCAGLSNAQTFCAQAASNYTCNTTYFLQNCALSCCLINSASTTPGQPASTSEQPLPSESTPAQPGSSSIPVGTTDERGSTAQGGTTDEPGSTSDAGGSTEGGGSTVSVPAGTTECSGCNCLKDSKSWCSSAANDDTCSNDVYIRISCAYSCCAVDGTTPSHVGSSSDAPPVFPTTDAPGTSQQPDTDSPAPPKTTDGPTPSTQQSEGPTDTPPAASTTEPGTTTVNPACVGKKDRQSWCPNAANQYSCTYASYLRQNCAFSCCQAVGPNPTQPYDVNVIHFVVKDASSSIAPPPETTTRDCSICKDDFNWCIYQKAACAKGSYYIRQVCQKTCCSC